MLSGTPVSSTNKIDRLDITEILLKVRLYLIDWMIKGTGNQNGQK
jgi:hypothetical protein